MPQISLTAAVVQGRRLAVPCTLPEGNHGCEGVSGEDSVHQGGCAPPRASKAAKCKPWEGDSSEWAGGPGPCS